MTVRINSSDEHGVHIESFIGVTNIQYETCGNGNFFRLEIDKEDPLTFLATEGNKIEITAD